MDEEERRILMKMKNLVLDSLYPRRCPACHGVVKEKGGLICRDCAGKFKVIRQPRCVCCGKTLISDREELCADCREHRHWFDAGMAVFVYEEVMRSSMDYFKGFGRKEYGDFYVEAMARCGRRAIERWRPQLVIPVPMTAAKLRKRGFNQAQVLAEGLAEKFSLPVSDQFILRTGQGKEQKTLNAAQRRRSLLSAFETGSDYRPLESVLLVDDVYTTGSTMDAMARLLKRNDTQCVYFLALAQGKGF